MKKRVVSILLTLLLLAQTCVVSLAASPGRAATVRPTEASAATLTADASKTALHPGETSAITASEACVFTSGNENIAIVDENGVITAVAAGTARITCRSAENTAYVDVVVFAQGTAFQTLSSPNGEVTMTVYYNEAGIGYFSQYRDVTVVELSDLGISTSVGDFSSGLTFVGTSAAEIDERYEMRSGKKSEYVNHANEVTFAFTKDGVTLHVVARVYDDGMAYRYRLEGEQGREISFDGEKSSFTLPAGSTVWSQSNYSDYQGSFSETKIEALSGNRSMPLTYKTADNLYAFVSEAALTPEYCGSIVNVSGRVMKVVYTPYQTTAPQSTLPFESPWRLAVMGGLENVMETTMVENLNPANVIEDTSWIQPGTTSWSWLIAGGQSRAATHYPFIDLAAELGWKYYIIDDGWQTTPPYGTNPWFLELLSYANAKGIGMVVWIDVPVLVRYSNEEIASILREWADMGIAGIKIDHFNRIGTETQSALAFYEMIYERCAEYGLLINMHGSAKPTGQIRTYPHILTSEGIRGQEVRNMSAAQNIVLACTRNVAGAADYTPTLTPLGSSDTTTAHQAALSVLYESGMNCQADTPSVYLNSPARSLFQNLPSAWEDSKLLEGECGDLLTIARKSGEEWYVVSVCDGQTDAEMNLNFLGDGEYTAYVYRDGETKADFAFDALTVTKQDTLTVPMLAGGGCVVRISNQLSDPESISLSEDDLVIAPGETATLIATVQPADTDFSNVVWASSNSAVASVENGVVTAKRKGTTVITASTGFAQDIVATCTVKVDGASYVLASPWEIRNPVSENYTFDSETSVTVMTQSGAYTTGSDSVKNMFRIKSGDENFTISTKIEFLPTDPIHTAGIIVDNGAGRYYSIMRRYHTGLGGNVIAVCRYDGGYTEPRVQDTYLDQEAMYLKIEKTGNTFQGYYSMDNENWTPVGDPLAVSNLNTGNTYCGLFIHSGSQNPVSIPAKVSDFTYNGEVIPFAINDADTDWITGVEAADAVTVPHGTALEDIVLPETLKAVVNYGEEERYPVTWAGHYDPAKAGSYTLEGTLELPDGYKLDAGISIAVTVKVLNANSLTLASPWEIRNPDDGKYTINSERSVTVMTQSGAYTTGSDSVKNMFRIKSADENFTISTKIEFQPTAQIHTAGIIVDNGAGRYYSIMRRYHTGLGGNVIAVCRYDGGYTEPRVPDTHLDQAEMYLKIEKTGNTFQGYYSMDNENWIAVGDPLAVSNLNTGNTYCGLFIHSGGQNPVSIPARVSDFTYNGEVIPFAAYKGYTITGVPNAEQIRVPFGTKFEQLPLPKTINVMLDSGEECQLPVTWDAADYNAKQGGTYEVVGTPVLPAGYSMAGGLYSRAEVFVTPFAENYTVISDVREAMVSEEFTFTIETDKWVTSIAMFNENNGKIGLASVEKKTTEQGIRWTFTARVETPGERVFHFQIRDEDRDWLDIGATLSIDILTPKAAVTNFSFDRESAAEYEVFNASITTTAKVYKVKIHNENGKEIGKQLVSKTTLEDGSIHWVYNISVGTAGQNRQLTATAALSDGVYTELVKTASIDIVKP